MPTPVLPSQPSLIELQNAEEFLLAIVIGRTVAGARDEQDARFFASRQLHEPFEHVVSHSPPAMQHHRPRPRNIAGNWQAKQIVVGP